MNQQDSAEQLEIIRQFWERIEVLHSVVSEQMIDAQSGEQTAADLLSSIDMALQSQLSSVLSAGQSIYYDCKLPHQPKHSCRNGYVCKDDSTHKFCRSHVLKKCAVCGGDLR